MEEIINELKNINDALGEIFTKGQDSFIMIQCRQHLFNIIEKLNQPKFIEINLEDKKE